MIFNRNNNDDYSNSSNDSSSTGNYGSRGGDYRTRRPSSSDSGYGSRGDYRSRGNSSSSSSSVYNSRGGDYRTRRPSSDDSSKIRAVNYTLADLALKGEIQNHSADSVSFMVPELGYNYNALAPYIDAQTMELHLTQHHKSYVSNLNAAVVEYKDLLNNRDIVDMLYYVATMSKKAYFLDSMSSANTTEKNRIKNMIRVIRNNAGGHLNHSMFWQFLSPESSQMSASLSDVISKHFMNIENFKNAFANIATSRVGSYWVWLVAEKTIDGHKLRIISTQNQDSPLMFGYFPLLGLDMWEHAYYLAYFNDKAAYAKNFWNIINWNYVESLYLTFLAKQA